MIAVKPMHLLYPGSFDAVTVTYINCC